jgi:hypothetical protein
MDYPSKLFSSSRISVYPENKLNTSAIRLNFSLYLANYTLLILIFNLDLMKEAATGAARG